LSQLPSSAQSIVFEGNRIAIDRELQN